MYARIYYIQYIYIYKSRHAIVYDCTCARVIYLCGAGNNAREPHTHTQHIIRRDRERKREGERVEGAKRRVAITAISTQVHTATASLSLSLMHNLRCVYYTRSQYATPNLRLPILFLKAPSARE